MSWLNGDKIRLIIVWIVVVTVLGDGNAKADFTFGEPTNLGSIVNSASSDWGCCTSSDGLSLLFSSNREGGSGGWDIWMSIRVTTAEEWESPENLGPVVNSSALDGYPAISTDGLELYFMSDRQGGIGGVDLYVAKRAMKSDAWGEPVNLGSVVNSSGNDSWPSLSADDLELYFTAGRETAGGWEYSLYMIKRETVDASWGQPTDLGPIVNSWPRQICPTISSDGRLLLFCDYWVAPFRSGGFGASDIWCTSRIAQDSEWGEPVNVGLPINTPFYDEAPKISVDGSTLYFASNQPGGYGSDDLWQASILPIVDFDGDGNVEISDLMLMVESWGTDDPRYDIGPMPWGDGTVDAADLDVLMASWGQAVDFPYDPGKASKPIPVDGSTKPVDELRWSPGYYAIQHDVYLGQDPGAVENADISDVSGIYRGRQDSIRYTPLGILDSGATFFWRIDEIHTDGTIKKGLVWSFTVADLLVVDDFENYIAEGDMYDPGQIYFTWIDGWDDDQNGSLVGYANPPWIETTIVHGGLHSMPFFYDNSNTLISQTFREWPDPQDWTVRGVQVLTLWLYAEPDNTAERFYVGLEDGAGNRKDITHPDPAALTVNDWQQWRIPMADFTDIDLTAIKIMYIGVGDPAGNQPGGSGLVRIDDIELHLPSE
jgi:Tol biopolymer transport system component